MTLFYRDPGRGSISLNKLIKTDLIIAELFKNCCLLIEELLIKYPVNLVSNEYEKIIY